LKEACSATLKPGNSFGSSTVQYYSCSTVLMRVFFADGGGGASPSSFFTRRRWVLDAPDGAASFFGQRRQVLHTAVEGGEPMMMPPARGVLGVDEEERGDEDAGSPSFALSSVAVSATL
jgi:hypothetical protein